MNRTLVALVAALAILNASLSFHNVWPTPIIGWRGELSLEFAAMLLLLAALTRWWRVPRSRFLRGMAALWVVLAIGHYADVTTPALYGRDINLYWDAQYMPDVAAMIARAAPLWLIAAAVAAVALAIAILFLMFCWAFYCVAQAMAQARARRWLAALAIGMFVVFGVQKLIASRSTEVYEFDPVVTFAPPVTLTYARQARLVLAARAGEHTLPPSPKMDADLARVRGADVTLIFIESYGALAYERPDIARPLEAARTELAAAIRDTHQQVVTAFVESPTFGGSSWLAHISLMSGIEVRDPATNASLMSQQRETLVTAFKRQGYRTVAMMPGLRQRWPEGAFYGFDEIYGAARLDYRGPEFGWFAVPDQFSLARVEALERDARSQAPTFMFFPTISTHFPFIPSPPYQPDWARMLTDHPYGGRAIVEAYDHEPDWTSFGPGYVRAMTYTYQTLAGYLRMTAGRDRVLIVLGDHQPAAAVSGEGATWDVPVHVIAPDGSRPDRSIVLATLRQHGFGAGLTPHRPPLGKMHTLLPLLLDAFSAPPPRGQP